MRQDLRKTGLAGPSIWGTTGVPLADDSHSLAAIRTAGSLVASTQTTVPPYTGREAQPSEAQGWVSGLLRERKLRRCRPAGRL